MGPVATKAMKGYSDEDLHSDLDYKVCYLLSGERVRFNLNILDAFIFNFSGYGKAEI